MELFGLAADITEIKCEVEVKHAALPFYLTYTKINVPFT